MWSFSSFLPLPFSALPLLLSPVSSCLASLSPMLKWVICPWQERKREQVLWIRHGISLGLCMSGGAGVSPELGRVVGGEGVAYLGRPNTTICLIYCWVLVFIHDVSNISSTGPRYFIKHYLNDVIDRGDIIDTIVFNIINREGQEAAEGQALVPLWVSNCQSNHAPNLFHVSNQIFSPIYLKTTPGRAGSRAFCFPWWSHDIQVTHAEQQEMTEPYISRYGCCFGHPKFSLQKSVASVPKLKAQKLN